MSKLNARDFPDAVLQGRCLSSPVAPGEPRPHVRFQERLSDLAMSLSKLRELVMDRRPGVLQSIGLQSRTRLSD